MATLRLVDFNYQNSLVNISKLDLQLGEVADRREEVTRIDLAFLANPKQYVLEDSDQGWKEIGTHAETTRSMSTTKWLLK